MSQENVEIVRRCLELSNRRDLGAFLALMDSGVEFTAYERAVEGLGPYRAHDGVRTWWEEAFATIPDLGAELYEVRDLGDITLARGRLRGTGSGSGASFERTLWMANEWRDRKQVWWRAFASEGEAVEAAGLRE